MRNLLYRMNATMARFMTGRYGVDEFSKLLLIVSIILFILSNFSRWGVLYYIAVVLMLWSLYRCYSRRCDKRTKERHIYLKTKDQIRYGYKIRKRMWAERKTHKYFKCGSCGHYFRVPKGAGNIVATCPGCKEKMKISS